MTPQPRGARVTMASNARNDATVPPRAGPTTRKAGGNIVTPKESQDIKDSLEGRKFLESTHYYVHQESQCPTDL